MKILLFAIVLLAGYGIPANQTVSTETTDVHLKKKIEVDVEIDVGRKKKGCAGFGVCGIVVSGGIKDIMEPGRVGGVATVVDGRVESLSFDIKTMSHETYKMFFADGIFTIGETVKEKFGKGFLLHLKIGDYDLKKTKSGFLLEVSG